MKLWDLMPQEPMPLLADSFVVAVENTHPPTSGLPPNIARSRNQQIYVGFFESQQGDQFTVEIDRQTKKGVVRTGKTHWSNEVEIRENRLQSDVLVQVEEFVWLTACWAAATGAALEYPDNFA
jgi:hypothetical protein